jgi:hypothetical protein
MRYNEENDSLTELIPAKGYFRDYYLLGESGEICPRFLFFAAAAALGSVVNRKIYFQRGSVETFPTTYPNPWIILTAPQGVGRKTSSLRMAYTMLKALPDYSKPNILASKFTPEVLVSSLATKKIAASTEYPGGKMPDVYKNNAVGLLYSTELAVLLGREKYLIGLIPLLTELYDCHDEWNSKTIGRGEDVLYNVCLSLIAASTPDWMQKLLPEDAFAGGFMSRILLIAMPINWNKMAPDPIPADPTVRERLLKTVERIANITGQMNWEPDAKEFFLNYYYKTKKKAPTVLPFEAYKERKHDHLLRFAMLLQISNTYEELVMRKESLETALKILDRAEEETKPVIEFIATPPKMRPARLVLEVIRRHKVISESQLYRRCFTEMHNPKDLETILQTLLKGKMIKIANKGGIAYEYVAAQD